MGRLDAAAAANPDPDDWWWLAVVQPGQDTHLYELGYSVYSEHTGPWGQTVRTATVLTDERQQEILAELGNPEVWSMEQLCGRPRRYLEPKTYAPDGRLTPIRARPGVILHLKDPAGEG